jgi:DNA-binding NarL/FixJ family response regulator
MTEILLADDHAVIREGLKTYIQKEEHMVVRAGEGHLWKVGDLLYGLPIHI